MPFLVSFCNQMASPLHSLCAMDLSSEVVRWVDLSLISEEYRAGFSGVSGICMVGTQVVIATQGAKPVLALTDLETARLSAYVPLCKCKDLHSIVYHDGYIYIVSTGTNEVYRVSFRDGVLGTEELYWQYPSVRYDRDEIHLNGLTIDGDRFIASCFGARGKDGSWTSNGKVFYLDAEDSVLGGLRHPHTPIVVGDRLFFAESLTHKVYVYKKLTWGAWALDNEIQLDGYTRGIAYQDGRLLVGVSATRKISRSKKSLNSEVLEALNAAIVVFDAETGQVEKVFDLVKYGREIYDINTLSCQLQIRPESDQVASRIIEMESEIVRYTADLANLWKQHRISELVATEKVSVIIPTYNRAHLIGASIKSVLDQSYTNLELIVVDDGSEDNTKEVVSELSDSRLRYIWQPNRGRSNARNHALSLARGRYIAFLDSDDLFLPDKLERQVTYLRGHPGVGMVYTSAHCIDQQGTMLEHKYLATVSGCVYEKIAFFTPVTITLPTVMTYRDILSQVGGFDEAMYRFEDTDMWRRISKVCRVDAMPDFTCLLRTHDDNSLVNQNAGQIAAAVDYYAAKILRDDEDIDLSVRRHGLAGLYRYYGHALCSVPEFLEIGKRLLRTAKDYDSKLINSDSRPVYLARIVYYRWGLNRLLYHFEYGFNWSRYWGAWTARFVNYRFVYGCKWLWYWGAWGIRFIYYRTLNVTYRLYSKIRQLIKKN